MISTDDAARGIDYPYRGAPGVPLPAARIPAYMLFLSTTVAIGVLVFVLAPNVWFRVAGLLAAPVLALRFTRRVMPNVSYWTPFRYWFRLLWRELNTPRALPVDTPERATELDPKIFK